MKTPQKIEPCPSYSSFCIIGYILKCEEPFWDALYNKIYKIDSTEVDKYDKEIKRLIQKIEYAKSENYDIFSLDIVDGASSYPNSVIIGRHIMNLDENKTILENRQEICDTINKDVFKTNKITLSDILTFIDGGINR